MSELRLRGKLTGKKTVAAKDPTVDLPKIIIQFEIELDDNLGNVNNPHDIHQLDFGCGHRWFFTMTREQLKLPTIDDPEDDDEPARMFPQAAMGR